MYDFNAVINRQSTGSVKWDFVPESVKKAGTVPLTIADMEFSVSPEIKSAIVSAAEHGIYGYTYPDEVYLKAVTDWMKRRHKWNVEPEWILTAPGIVNALGVALRALTQPKDGVIIQPPVYTPFKKTIVQNRRLVLENPLLESEGRYEMDFSQLEELCARPEAKMIILCSPHNPVGRVWTREELTKLGRICKKHDVTVVSDEIHSDILLFGSTHHVFADMPEMAESCVILTAASKTFNLAGLSCSNVIIPGIELRKRYKSLLKIEFGRTIPYFARAATISAYGKSEYWLTELIAYLENTFDMFYEFLQTRLPMIGFSRAEGTYLAWTDLRVLGLTDSEQEKLMLEKARLALDEGYIFGTGGSGFERWNLAAPRNKIIQSLESFETAVKSVL